METLEQLRQQLTSDLKTSFLKRASDTDSSRKPEAVIGEVSLMLATNIADYSEKLLREIVTPGYVTDEYDKRYTLLSIFNEHEANLREAKHINAEQLAIIDRVTSWFAFDEEHNAVYVKNNYNFYAEGAVSARGFATGGGGGGGGMDEDLLWSILGDGDNPDKQIALSHLEKVTSYVASNYYTKDQIRTTYLTASEIADKYISKSAFPGIFAEEMANWFKKDADGNIYAEVNFYSTKGVSAKGLNPGSGGGGGMDEDLLWSILGDGDNPDKQIASTHLTKALAGYATKDWVTDKHYATEQWVTGKGYSTVTWVTETFVRKDDYDSLWDAKMANWFKKDTDGNIYTTVNFYSEQGVSAKGANTSGGGGGGMDEELLWSILGDGDNPGKQIAITHLTTALANYTTVTQVNEAINNKVKDYIPLSAKGAANGVAPLGSDGLISANYLPSYVDDVLEYDNLASFPAVGETGKIYVTKDKNLTYRWTGTQYVEISKSLALGETVDTAYAGSKGKENRDAINKLKAATFWGATYQNDGNVYGTFTGTKIVLSELIQTPKIKIGDIYLEYDAEHNAIKGVKYATDGTEVAANLYVTGGLSAKGFSPTSGGGGSTTLADLLDTNITDPQNRQALVYDSSTQKWINETIVAGSNISLNGTTYSPVAGTITLPNLYEKVSGGTSSQFLKADGSIDSNLYALAINGDQNYVSSSNFANLLRVQDTRSDVPKPNTYATHTITATFNASNGMPDGNWWSGFHVRGWGDGYCTWELMGPSSTNNTAYNLRYRTGIGDTWGAWKMIMTDVEADGRYVIKTGDTMTGRLTAPDVFATTLWATSTLRSNLLLTVGASNNIIVANRAELHLITPSDNPCDLWMGANNGRRWSITARGSGEDYQLGIYNNTRSNWNVFFRDDINDFRVKTEVRNTFLVVPSDIGGGYNEGIRICNGSNNWSNIQFGAQNAWNGNVDGQWIVGKDPVKNFQICLAGTETSNGSRPSKGIHIDINGYLHTGYVSTEINPDNQGDYFYSSNDTFLRRSTWHAALSHLSNKQLTLDLTSLDQNKWYPCVVNAPAYGGTPLRITLFNGLRGNKPSWASHTSGFSLLLDYQVTGSGWGTLAAVAKLNWYAGSYGGETAFGGRQQNTMASEEIIYLRGGGLYYYRTTNGNSITVYSNGYSWANGPYTYNAPIKTSQDNSPIEKTFDQVYWLPNALRETRTFWGQPFNGSQNVSGALSGVTTINASNTIYTAGDISNGGYIYCNGRLFVDRGRYSATASPAISLAIGDTDTGLHWSSDGAIELYANAVAVGGWNESQFRYGHGYFKQATGNDYHTLGIMVNGNGTANSIKPGIGFHQPGVYANSIRSDGAGDFKFCVQGGTVGCTVQAANFYANGGFLYSSANGCELKIGAQNSFYVHFTTNPARSLYFANSIHISGEVIPYTNEAYVLGNSGHWWGGIYGKEVYVSSWVRFTGASGVYWTAYSGGWTMNDTTYIRSYGGKSLWIEGNILANGGITAKQASDRNLKTILKRPDYQEMILRLGMAEAYNYNSIATSRKEGNVREGWHIGIMYQNAKEVLPQITGLCDDGYGYVNYHDTDLTGLMIGAIQMNILAQKTTEQRLEEALLRIETLEGILEANGLLNRNHIGI